MGVGVPVISGKVEGKNAQAIFDTRCDSSLIGLASQMYQRILPILRRHRLLRTHHHFEASFSHGLVTIIRPVHWQLPGIKRTGGAFIIPHLEKHVDMVIGYGLLPQWRVTIDYPDQLVWIELVPHGDQRKA